MPEERILHEITKGLNVLHLIAARIHALTIALEGLKPPTNSATKQDLCGMEQRIMSQITDWAAQEQVDLGKISDALDTLILGVRDMVKQIADLNKGPGEFSAADQPAFDKLQATAGGLLTKVQSVLATANTPDPEPVPEPTTQARHNPRGS